MTYFSSFLMGLVQGLAEFLPISSSGHLAIAQNLLGLETEVPVFFDVLLHLGTLLAVFVAYWKDICEIVVEFFRGIRDIAHHTTPKQVPPARRMILLIIVATLPLVVVLPFHEKVQALGDNMVFVGAALVVTGFLLFACDLVRKGRKTAKNATLLDALVVGVGQAIATMPGISRSGMTITAGCFCGYERSFAVRFSFLMSIPAILGACVLELPDMISQGVASDMLVPLIVGSVTACAVGFLAIKLLQYLTKNKSFTFFAVYCIVVGLAAIIADLVIA